MTDETEQTQDTEETRDEPGPEAVPSRLRSVAIAVASFHAGRYAGYREAVNDIFYGLALIAAVGILYALRDRVNS